MRQSSYVSSLTTFYGRLNHSGSWAGDAATHLATPGIKRLCSTLALGVVVWRECYTGVVIFSNAMKLGVISDTHEHLDNIEKAKKVFAQHGASPIIHLGDYCSGPSVRAFAGSKIVGIYGNNDGDLLRIQGNMQKIGGDFRGEFCVLKFDDLEIACYHGTVPEITEALIDSGTYDVVLYGHTHETHQETRKNVLVLNPGSAHGFGKAGTVAIIDTNAKTTEIIELA